MNEYINLSSLNDFCFCPYSIYLHNVYESTDKELFQAAPQVRGSLSHQSIDTKQASTQKEILLSLPVYSETYHIMGKIDLYDREKGALVERKYKLGQIYRGQLYQLWGQYLCLIEMNYEVTSLAFFEISTHKTIPIALPSSQDLVEFKQFINRFLSYDPLTPLSTSINKCRHCIYCNLCDKTDEENVYT